MKAVNSILTASMFVFVFVTAANAITLYSAPLRATAGDTFVCHVLSVSPLTLPQVFVDIVVVNGGGVLAGGNCTGMGLGDNCWMDGTVTGSKDAYCKISVRSRVFVRANLTVVNSAGETISSVPVQ